MPQKQQEQTTIANAIAFRWAIIQTPLKEVVQEP